MKKLASIIISMLLFATVLSVAVTPNIINENNSGFSTVEAIGPPQSEDPSGNSDWTMKIENTTAEPGNTGHVVQINGTWAAEIIRYTFKLEYDPEMIEVIEVNADGCVGEGGYVVTQYGDDWFMLYVASIQVPAGEGKLGNLIVNITGGLGVTELTFIGGNSYNYYLDNQNNNHYPTLINGHITIEGDDITPPVTNCTLEGEMEGNVYISNVTVTLTAIDDFSGVNYTMYKLDNGEYQTYEEPFNVSDEGDHIVYYYSVDNAGNEEDEKNCTFTIEHEQLTPDLNIKSIEGGKGITVTIENNGDGEATGMDVNITIEGGLIIFPGEYEYPDTIAAGGSVEINMSVFGVGLGIFTPMPEITVTATCAEESSAEGSEEATIFLNKVTIQE